MKAQQVVRTSKKSKVIAKARAASKAPSLSVKSSRNSSNQTPSLGYASPVASGNYGGVTEAKPNRPYLTFVVQRYDGQWAFVRVNQHCLDCYQEPCVFDQSSSEDMLEIWKRVVIDNAIPWEDSVRPETLRIIEYSVAVEDKTLSLFGSDGEVKEFMRLSAMVKLSDAEARLLGLTHLKAKQKIIHNPVFHRDDGKVLTSLMKESARLTLGSQLSFLHE